MYISIKNGRAKREISVRPRRTCSSRNLEGQTKWIFRRDRSLRRHRIFQYIFDGKGLWMERSISGM